MQNGNFLPQGLYGAIAPSGASAWLSRLIPVVFFVPVQGVDLVHFLLRQLKMIELRVFSDVLRVAGAGDDHYALLQIHPQYDLGSRYVVG